MGVRDAIVVGAGPSGSYLSYELSRMGYDVLNLEEHNEVGKPVECTGLVSERVFRYVKSRAKVNSVSGAHIYFPNGEEVHVAKSEKTIVMERDVFDRDAAGQSIGAGTDLRLGSKVSGIKGGKESVKVTFRENGNTREEECRVVVGADGVNSVVRKEVFRTRPSRIISTYQVDSSFRMEDQDSVDVYLGSESSKGFFGWATPSGDISRIGVGSYGQPFNYFSNINRRFKGERILGINGGGIPITYLKRTYSDRCLLVGDAAGIVKPLTGGGIYTGIVSASHAARTLEKALENNNLSSTSLSSYQRRWKRDIGKELLFDGLIQRIFGHLSDKSLNRIYEIISDEKIIGTINSRGDIDYPSKLIIPLLLKNPGLIKHLFKVS